MSDEEKTLDGEAESITPVSNGSAQVPESPSTKRRSRVAQKSSAPADVLLSVPDAANGTLVYENQDLDDSTSLKSETASDVLSEQSDLNSDLSVTDAKSQSEPEGAALLVENHGEPENSAAGEGESLALPQSTVQSKEPKKFSGFFARLTMRRSKREGLTEEPILAETEPLTTQNREERLNSLRARAADLKTQISERDGLISDEERKLDAIQKEVDRVAEWVSSVSRSYIWSVQAQMGATKLQVDADLRRYEQAVADVSLPEQGILLALRRKFHSRLTRFSFIVLPVMLLVAFLPDMMKWKLPEWLQQLNRSDVSTAIGVFIIVLTIGAWQVVAHFGGFKRMSKKASILWRLGIFCVSLMVVFWPPVSLWINRYLVPFLQKNLWTLLAYLSALYVVVLFGLLVSYYRDWGQFRQSVRQQIIALRGVAEGYVKTRQEEDRLSKMYEQTTEWLSILAHALYRPWRINPAWYENSSLQSNVDSFPMSMRIATANEGLDARRLELERKIGSHLLIQGWRSKAFEDLVAAVGDELGLAPGKFKVDLLDADLPHESNNSRKILERFLHASARSAKEGELLLSPALADTESGVIPPTDRYLVDVARQRLAFLISETQRSALAEARPRVTSLSLNELAGLHSDRYSVDFEDDSVSWDDFLSESLGFGESTQVPLSPLGFSDEATIKSLHEHPRSFVLVPVRLAEKVSGLANGDVTVIPIPETGNQSVELIARIDLVGPVSYDDLSVFGSRQAPTKASTPAAVVDDNDTL